MFIKRAFCVDRTKGGRMAAELGEQAAMLMVKVGSEITLTILKSIVQKLIENNNEHKHGEQSMKALNMQGKKLDHVELPGQDIKSFRRALKKYAVDFSVMRDRVSGTYSVFFKGQDTDRIYAGLKSVLKEAVTQKEEKRHIKDFIDRASKRAEEVSSQQKLPPVKERITEMAR